MTHRIRYGWGAYGLILWLLAPPPTLAEEVLVGFGDSITAGYPYVPAKYQANGCRCPEQGYEIQLEALLYGSGRPASVLNYGVGGETSSRGSKRLNGVLDASNPDIVLLLDGTNDLCYVDPGSTVTVLAEMVDKIRAKGANVILGTFPPDTRSNCKDIPTANSALRSMAEQKKVKVADQYAALVENWSAWSDDGLHPNVEGYGVMAKTWLAAILPPITLPWLEFILD